MKKIIKILSLLFLLSGTSNLAGSQNIQTLAMEKNINTDDNSVEKNHDSSDSYIDYYSDSDYYSYNSRDLSDKESSENESSSEEKDVLDNVSKNDGLSNILNFGGLYYNFEYAKEECESLISSKDKQLSTQAELINQQIDNLRSTAKNMRIGILPKELYEDNYNEISAQLITLIQESEKTNLKLKVEKFVYDALNKLQSYNHNLEEIKKLREEISRLQDKIDDFSDIINNDLFPKRNKLATEIAKFKKQARDKEKENIILIIDDIEETLNKPNIRDEYRSALIERRRVYWDKLIKVNKYNEYDLGLKYNNKDYMRLVNAYTTIKDEIEIFYTKMNEAENKIGVKKQKLFKLEKDLKFTQRI